MSYNVQREVQKPTKSEVRIINVRQGDNRMGKRISIIVISMLIFLNSSFALTIEPKPITGIAGKNGQTSHKSINAIFKPSQPKNWIQCYIKIDQPIFAPKASLHMTIVKKGINILSGGIYGYKRDGKIIFNFAIDKEYLEESYVNIYVNNDYYEMKLNTIEIQY